MKKIMDTTIGDLPISLPLLPLHGAVLLPRSQLPIPIFEIDYLTMVAESLKTHHIIGVVQPIVKDISIEENIPLFRSGCAGKITDINEIEDGRLLVTLAGLCRFDIVQELPTENGQRKATVSYDRYIQDLVEEVDFSFDRPRLLKALETYFRSVDITPNWQEIGQTSNEKLITALAMVCPLEAREKQALLETPTLKEQSQMFITLIEMAALEKADHSIACH
jgi:Lon protease-like protein